MLTRLPVLAVLVLYPAAAIAQSNVTIGASGVRAAHDFATRAFQDPWDMNERTDLGAFLDGTDQPAPNMSGITFSGGIFSGTTTTTDPSVFLLDTGNPFAARLGKTGSNHPIDADSYQVLAFRMRADQASMFELFWWRGTIFDNPSTLTWSAGIATTAGWRTYLVHLPSVTPRSPGGISTPFAWAGPVGALRLDPTQLSNEAIQIDWARLVSVDPSLCRTIHWDGGGTVDIHLLDASTNASLGRIAVAVSGNSASPGCSAAGSGYTYFAGALAPGSYRVGVVSAGGTPSGGNISAGTWVVNDIPTLQFTSPSEEGSSDDFATTVLGNAWDMADAADVEYIQHINSPQFTTLSLQTAAGADLGSQTVFTGTSIAGPGAGFGDPHLGLLWNPGRGATQRIDPQHYRILTLEMGVPNLARNINEGSIARIAWRVAGNDAGGESVSDDIIFTSRAGASVVNKIIVDMADRTVLPIEEGSPLGWVRGSAASPGLDLFRIDPHEYTPATPFLIRRVKLAAFERTSGTYNIRWAFHDSGTGTVDLYYDSDASGFDGTLIAANVPAANGTHAWDTTAVTLPQAFIYAVFRDSFAGGGNENRVYAKWPIVLTHNAPPQVAVDKPSLRFAATHTGSGLAAQTAGQTVRIRQTGAGAATWTASSNQPWLTVSPGSGSGPAALTLNVQHHASLPFSGTATGAVTLTFTGAEPASLSVAVTLSTTLHGTSSAPVGVFDTPADGLTGLTGSLALTGWALDDLDVGRVRILRSVNQGSCNIHDPGSLLFIGDATLVEGARPDVAAANPTVPRNTRAGWGYMLLSNFLQNLGTGTFTLCAVADDVEGHSTLVGSRTLTFDNANAVKPFGAIDTPAQGATIGGTSYNNFGWVLSRTPSFAAPPDGGSVTVFINSVPVGAPGGWTSRTDLAGLFPAAIYPGVSSAAGVFTFNPASIGDGVHTIAWSVRDSDGDTDGVGSRFFTIVGTGASSVVATVGRSFMGRHDDAVRRPFMARLDDAPLDARPVRARRGFDLATRFRTVDARGGRATIHGEELDRFEVELGGGGALAGYMRVGNDLGPLPIGSHLDPATGTYGWMPGVGFVGTYDLVFVRTDGRMRSRQEVRFVLHPKGSSRVGPQVMIDTPASGVMLTTDGASGVSRQILIAGWALDLDDPVDTGVGTLHVWAYPVDDATGQRLNPRFLGVTSYGGARADVAAVFGDRYLRTGYGLLADGLEPGTYDIAVFAWSTARHAFVPAHLVRVHVR